MNIVISGRFSGWMGGHMRQIASGYEACGWKVFCLDYPSLSHKCVFFRRSFDEFNRAFLEKVKACDPDVILLTMARRLYDIEKMRAIAPRAKICVWDFDGPNWGCWERKDCDLEAMDLVLTVSRKSEDAMRRCGIRCAYLPHGVDCNFYRRMAPSRKFSAPVSYIGLATDRRISICRKLSGEGLALYGKRWHQNVQDEMLKKCIRSKRDVTGETVPIIYSSSGCIVNMLQGKLAEEHTILSIQVFAVPASEGCLITENTIELAESFVPGKELLVWESEDELLDKVRYCVCHPDEARRIGEAGRARCLASHTSVARARAVLQMLGK